MRYISVGQIKDSKEYGVWICDDLDKKELVSRHEAPEFIRRAGKLMAEHLDVQLLDLMPSEESEIPDDKTWSAKLTSGGKEWVPLWEAEQKLQEAREAFDEHCAVDKEVYEINRNALLRAGVNMGDIKTMDMGAIAKGKTITSQAIDLLAEQHKEESLAKVKGAAARVMGFEPVAKDAGYSGRNAKAWQEGWAYMDDTMRPITTDKVLPWMRTAANGLAKTKLVEDVGVERLAESFVAYIAEVYWRSFYEVEPKLPAELQRVLDIAQQLCESAYADSTHRLVPKLREAGKAWHQVYPPRTR